MTKQGQGITVHSEFLQGVLSRPLSLAGVRGLSPIGLFLGQGQAALEVAVVSALTPPTDGALQVVWKSRRAGRATPVLLVALHEGLAWICGPTGEAPPVHGKLDIGQAERLCREALRQPDRNAALRLLAEALPSLDTALPGIRNEGLLALHELTHGTPQRGDWKDATNRAKRAAGRNGIELLKGLGFKIERLDNLTQMLRSGDRRTALAVLLNQTESPEAGTARFNSLSPVSYALVKADSENLPWVVLVQDDRVRLYPTAVGIGVGRRGRTETYIECQPALLSDEHLAYLWLLFSADALKPDGSLPELLESSKRFAGNLAESLRDRIYIEVVPRLAAGLAQSRKLRNPNNEQLRLTYQMALTVLFRLLFIAYAEDRDLLPYRHNSAYRRRSVKQKAQELSEAVANGTKIAVGDSHWQEIAQLWTAVSVGNPEWGVPAYNGTLFSSECDVSPAGAELLKNRIPNEVFEPALRGLLLIDTHEGSPGPVDFRALGVREFGTIYEGLLESELSVAESDLALDAKNTYVPVKGRAKAVIKKGDIYLHDKSGSRKSSGSYYTKHFAVEHLLDGALEPALSDHIERLDGLKDDADAADAFFDFRVADIAMGSGHFLVAAIDRIERRLAEYLSRRSLPGVIKELATLRSAADKHLGELAAQTQIEDGQLLRRLIARRCIYGVDLNDLSVQLARLSIWIHTFVPGLPLSLLDHNLVNGNSLVGVGTVEEILSRFSAAGDPRKENKTIEMYAVDAQSLLGDAAKPLQRLARIADASVQDVQAAREAIGQAKKAISSTQALCDIVTALPIDGSEIRFQFDRWEEQKANVAGGEAHGAARRALEGLAPLHFPVAFPEVFLRKRSGFDVILGNPPWQEVTVEEHGFWARHSPGLRSLPQREMEAAQVRLRRERPDLVEAYKVEVAETERIRKVLTGGAYPGMGTGDPDLYKAFCWRFWHLVTADSGRIGVVLPRSALSAKGSTDFRLAVFGSSVRADVTMLLNRAGWVFDEAEHRYTIGLLCLTRGQPKGESIFLRGPYASLRALEQGRNDPPAAFTAEEVLSWNDTASLPLLPSEESIGVFTQLRRAPRLDTNDSRTWRARPDTELHATNQKDLMDLKSEKCPRGFWPVFKGESFDLWEPDTGKYYAWADPKKVIPWIFEKRTNSAKRRQDSAHAEFSAEYIRNAKTLACHSARVTFRDITNRTNQRTVIAALVPPNLFITNSAPYLLWVRGDELDQAYLLGVLSSIPLDWYARRFVETHVNYFVLNPFPVPRPERADSRWKRVVQLAGCLASVDDRFTDWARAIGVKAGPLKPADKEDMIHELDAVTAHLYGLNEVQLTHIFETFHEGWDYGPRLKAVLEHHRRWTK